MLLSREKYKQKRVILCIRVPHAGDEGNDPYYFNIPRQTVGLTLRTTKGATVGASEQIVGMQSFNEIIDAITPATDRGTTMSFRNFLQTVIPDADSSILSDIVALSGASDVELTARDDCEIVD